MAVSPAFVQRNETGNGFDPLSRDEIIDVVSVAQPPMARQPAGSTDAPAQETLLIERHSESKETMAEGEWARRADVFVYDYRTDVLNHMIVNLDTNTVDSVESVQGVQLPLNENERERAINLLFADEEGLEAISADFFAITGHPLTDPSQIEIRTFIFHADSMIDVDLGAAATCGIQRCAHILMYTPDDIALTALPIVNLSTGTLATLMPFVE